MKKTRWRKIIKVTKGNATNLMNTYYHHEHVQLTWHAGGTLNEKKEISLLNTLNSYANIIERTVKCDTYLLNKEWLNELMNFAD